jgi:uncharacterized protein with HEPN domain
MADELLQVWVVHHLVVIGEAAAKLGPRPPDESHIDWPAIVGMRNILVHRYFGIDLEAVWRVVEWDLGPLEAELRRLLDDPSSAVSKRE